MSAEILLSDPKVIPDTKEDNACWEEGVEAPPQKIDITPPPPSDPPEFENLPKHHFPQDVGHQDWQDYTE